MALCPVSMLLKLARPAISGALVSLAVMPAAGQAGDAFFAGANSPCCPPRRPSVLERGCG